MKRILLAALAAIFTINILNAVELVPTQELLAAYLERDSELKNLALELQKSKLNNELTQIDKGFYLKLSSGDMTFTFGDNSSFKVYPGVNATLPQYNNLGLNVSGQMSVQNGQASFDSASAKVSVDILSSNKTEREISLLKSQRSVLEAQRALTSKAVEKEKTFYKNISSLLSSILNIVSKKNSLNDEYIEFEKIKLQGYSKTSSSYIKEEMKVMNLEHELEAAIHSLITDYKIFYFDCGYEIEIPADTDFVQLIPDDIPIVEAVDINNYTAENYKQIESNLWNQKIKQMSRDAAKDFTLSANGGYTYKNSTTGNSNTVDAGVAAAYGGIGVDAGVHVPVSAGDDGAASPSVSLGITYTPNTFKKNKINDQLTEIEIEQEQMKVDSAYTDYEEAVREMKIQLEDIKWSEETNNKNYKMYVDVEKEMLDYYKRGFISERDYVSATINTIQSKVKGLINRIDLIVYNDDVKTKFVE